MSALLVASPPTLSAQPTPRSQRQPSNNAANQPRATPRTSTAPSAPPAPTPRSALSSTPTVDSPPVLLSALAATRVAGARRWRHKRHTSRKPTTGSVPRASQPPSSPEHSCRKGHDRATPRTWPVPSTPTAPTPSPALHATATTDTSPVLPPANATWHPAGAGPPRHNRLRTGRQSAT